MNMTRMSKYIEMLAGTWGNSTETTFEKECR